jgi:hypothetical protein
VLSYPANWQHASLPKTLSDKEIERLLTSLDWPVRLPRECAMHPATPTNAATSIAGPMRRMRADIARLWGSGGAARLADSQFTSYYPQRAR